MQTWECHQSFLLVLLFYMPMSSFPNQIWKYLMAGSAYLVLALLNFFLPYFLPVLVQCLSRNWTNLWVAIFHLDSVAVNFYSIIQDEYFYFPKASMLYYIMKYTVQGSFDPMVQVSIHTHFWLSTGSQKELPTFPSGM